MAPYKLCADPAPLYLAANSKRTGTPRVHCTASEPIASLAGSFKNNLPCRRYDSPTRTGTHPCAATSSSRQRGSPQVHHSCTGRITGSYRKSTRHRRLDTRTAAGSSQCNSSVISRRAVSAQVQHSGDERRGGGTPRRGRAPTRSRAAQEGKRRRHCQGRGGAGAIGRVWEGHSGAASHAGERSHPASRRK